MNRSELLRGSLSGGGEQVGGGRIGCSRSAADSLPQLGQLKSSCTRHITVTGTCTAPKSRRGSMRPRGPSIYSRRADIGTADNQRNVLFPPKIFELEPLRFSPDEIYGTTCHGTADFGRSRKIGVREKKVNVTIRGLLVIGLNLDLGQLARKAGKTLSLLSYQFALRYVSLLVF